MSQLVKGARESSAYRRLGKRLLDLAIVVPAAVLLLPLILLVALLVRIRLNRPIFFRQPRTGRDGRTFELVKFRTMRNAVDAQGVPLPDGQRLTSFGQKLRSWSLDELPQLWNVFRGDMSLVGPRPLLTHYLPLYSSEQARRHNVRPGITGWAQVNGRNAISWEEKFRLDVWYVDHHNLCIDLSILLKTALSVFRRHGISSGDHATMPEFVGTATSDLKR